MDFEDCSGKIIVVSGPSGVGKNTLVNLFLEREKAQKIVSATTRAKREGEIEGDMYYFISEGEFKDKIKKGEFLEYAHIYGKQYSGILKKSVYDIIRKGGVAIRDIEVQGFMQIKDKIPKKILKSIFLLPPSEEILRQRIRERAKISDEELDARMETMNKELGYSKYYDATITTIDGDIEGTYKLFLEKINELNK